MTIPVNAQLKVAQKINLLDGVTAINVYYFDAAFEEAQAIATIITKLEEWIETLYGTLVDSMKSTVTLGDMVLYQYDLVGDAWDNKGVGAPDVTFLDVSEMLPHGVSALVRGYTIEARTTGRKYLPGFTEGAQSDGAWENDALVDMAAFGDAWSTGKEVSPNNNLVPAVFSTRWKTTRVMSGVTVVLSDPAYQRRRRPGVGI